MTSSPIECMRASRRSASTRTVRAALLDGFSSRTAAVGPAVALTASSASFAVIRASAACAPAVAALGVVALGLGDGDAADVGDPRGGGHEHLVLVLAEHPHLDLAALEELDTGLRRNAADDLAVLAQRGRAACARARPA